MNYVSKVFSNVKEFYNEINSATLTGAIDVVIVEQRDGSYSCSPFHVRFGKIGVLRSREKVVDIEINGSPVDIHMKLGETGEAFFVEETEEFVEVPSHLATSPIPSYDIGAEIMKMNQQANSQNLKDTNQNEERINFVHKSKSSIVSTNQASSVYLTSSMSKNSYNAEASESDTVYTAASRISLQQGNKIGSSDTFLNSRASHSAEHSSNLGVIGTTRLSTSDTALSDKVCHPEILKSSLQLNIPKYMPVSQDDSDNAYRTPAVSDTCSNITNQGDQTVITDDDKLKMRKKRRKRSVIRKRKGRELKEQNSSDDESPEEIFQMDVDDVDESNHSVTNSTLNRTLIPLSATSEKLSENSMSYSLPDRFKSSGNFHEEASNSCENVSKEKGHEWQYKNNMPLNLDFHPFSDGDVTPIISPVTSRPPTPKSDTEYEIQKQESASQRETGENRWSWTWGELPVPPKAPLEKPKEEPLSDDETMKSKHLQKDEDEQRSMLGGMFRFMRKTKKLRHQPESEGIYLDDLNFDEPEIAKLYFPPRQYYNWPTVAPMLMSLLTFQRPLSENTVTALVKDHMPKKPKKSETKSYSWFYWRRSTTSQEDEAKKSKEVKKEEQEMKDDSLDKHQATDEAKLNEIKNGADNKTIETDEQVLELDHTFEVKDTDEHEPLKSDFLMKHAVTSSMEVQCSSEPEIQKSSVTSTTVMSDFPRTPEKKTNFNSKYSENDKSMVLIETTTKTVQATESPIVEEKKVGNREKFKKTLRLSSEQITQLNLKEGPNEVIFSVTTAYQGTTRCKCHIYLWKCDDKIVISDIDGTITKSDVLGHILPIIGKDWAQSGVAQLFTKIKNNGYQFLYLSARAIGQAHITREYLKSIKQGDVCLPDGPLLLNPSSLITAFHREVIEKKPEEFKISCLRDIQCLFPSSRNPFYAGYGNKINDVWAYRAVGIPISRIFTINHKGELKHELTQTFQSSYSGLSYVVDHVFPPLRRSNERDGPLLSDFEGSDEFSSFTYWRPPIPDIQIDISNANSSKREEKKKVIEDKK